MNSLNFLMKLTCTRVSRSGLVPLVIGVSFTLGVTATASVSDQMWMCDSAAEKASQESDVPLAILKAISRTETGRLKGSEVVPWPWTVNMEGKGVWFETRDAALAFAYRNYNRGARSFDVGCFQINYRWHHEAFASIEEMFEPDRNAAYAARFLSRLYQELGSWDDAVGAYHSRTPEYAAKYKKAYSVHYAEITAGSGPVARSLVRRAGRTRSNNFPLLKGDGETRFPGSLTRLANQPGISIFTSSNPLFEPRS